MLFRSVSQSRYNLQKLNNTTTSNTQNILSKTNTLPTTTHKHQLKISQNKPIPQPPNQTPKPKRTHTPQPYNQLHNLIKLLQHPQLTTTLNLDPNTIPIHEELHIPHLQIEQQKLINIPILKNIQINIYNQTIKHNKITKLKTNHPINNNSKHIQSNQIINDTRTPDRTKIQFKHTQLLNIVTGKQIGRASCRERV